jgi:hypothetical protein
VKVILQSRKQIERLQAVDAQSLEEVIVRTELFPAYIEMLGCQIQNFIECLFLRSHKSNFQARR